MSEGFNTRLPNRDLCFDMPTMKDRESGKQVMLHLWSKSHGFAFVIIYHIICDMMTTVYQISMHKNWKMHSKNGIQNNKIRQHSNTILCLQQLARSASPSRNLWSSIIYCTHSTRRGGDCCLKNNYTFLRGAFCLKCSRSSNNKNCHYLLSQLHLCCTKSVCSQIKYWMTFGCKTLQNLKNISWHCCQTCTIGMPLKNPGLFF